MDGDIYTADYMVSMLTDANAKWEKSNVYRLFKTFEKPIRDIYITTQLMTQYRCVDIATGETLDKIGSNYNISRAGMYDDMYRVYIKGAIARSKSDGSYNSVIRLLALIFNTDVSNVSLKEDYVTLSGSATVTIDKVPTKELNAIGMSIEQYSDLVQSILPIGVGLSSRTYEGTFAFATSNPLDEEYSPELDAEAGFADEEQTTGGTLSGIIQS